MTRPGSRFVALMLLMCAAFGSAGCLVLGTGRFYDEADIIFEERLLGSWKAVEDNASVIVERSEWRSYRIRYTQPTETGLLTGYLFKHGDALFLDVSPVRGKDFGVFVVPGHALVRVTIAGDDVTLAPLSYDWFARALSAKTLPALLQGSRGDRDQLLLGGERSAFWKWLATASTDDGIWAAPATFRKAAAPPVTPRFPFSSAW